MNLNFKLNKLIFPDGKILSRAQIIFETPSLNKSWLDEVLTDGDNDYTANEYLNIMNNCKTLSEHDRSFNGENWVWEINDNGIVTISDIYEEEDDWSQEDLRPSVTISVVDLKKIFLEYRKKAKEFRDKLPQMQKEEDRRRANASGDSKKGDA